MLQTNLINLEKKNALDFMIFCQRNPKACPLVGVSDVGSPFLKTLGKNIDVRTDVPSYNIYRDGELHSVVHEINNFWNENLVAFAIGCSFTFEHSLIRNGFTIDHINENKVVPMYKTNIKNVKSGPFGNTMVVSMRIFKKITVKTETAASLFTQNQLGDPFPFDVDIPEIITDFNSINLTKFEKTKVVIIGQAPYHGEGQAHGLSFSVKEGIKIPPSLLNIFKEIESDTGVSVDKKNGNLTRWATQGVLLLNSLLTVEKGNPLSHKNFGWEFLTDKVIQVLSEKRKGLVFILWGSHARSKKKLIDPLNNLIIESAHPSPLSAHRGFIGSKPFSKTNDYLIKNNSNPINWS